MNEVTVTFHGAAGTVTGSCFEIQGANKTIIVDCGMFQGTRSLEKLNYEKLPFDARDIDAVILTHAHLDHSGRLPCLYINGCSAPTYCTKPTADILKPLLQDSAKLQAASVERRNRRADRAGLTPFEPLYTGPDITALFKHIQAVDYCEEIDLGNGVSFRFWDARHIVGSASIEINIAGQRILVSGDIGTGAPIYCADQMLGGYDHVICESTYGDRDREDMLISERREELAAFVEDTVKAGGNLLIPAFAVERTQAILEDFAALFDSGRLSPVNVFLDAPLAQKITRTILRYRNSGLDIMNRTNIRFIQSVEESKKLNRMTGMVIIAGSGMCEGGRIRHHLIRNLPNRHSRLLFTGFQVAGTLGSVLRDGAKAVRISGNDVLVNAEIANLDGYSNHADRKGLLQWTKDRGPVSGTIFLVHGEEKSLRSFADGLAESGSYPAAIIPALGEKWGLQAATLANELSSPRADARRLVAPRDWISQLAELRASVDQKIHTLKSDKDREKLLRGLRRALESVG
ncbi:MBL fold metallo-hydrolase [Parasphingorhabdus halotolerans]|uniref:MBL fold metallo-hydrolase n=1 Tax=Parasphingorhabdus halotolerans TaxID=2725558 RepID=A0A6H2DS69_9SPHN|nr:MBL fold metallo-hydrolase [Parasphingorhabdus halotolerans]QJB70506.1 MBL fold metallo-hydrolase [Parasphingorhabdus halotolerans]